MVSLAAKIIPSTQLPLLSSITTHPTFSSSSKSLTFTCKTIRNFRFHCAYKSKKASTLKTRKGTWEEPDDGSGSDYDEEEELGFESDWEEEKITSSSISRTGGQKCEVNLMEEIEQLLEPEERAILQQNVGPNLGKISTATWSLLHTLALSGQILEMDKLIDNGLDIDMPDKDGLTALHQAVIGKKEAVTSHLLRKGANPRVIDSDGITALHYAVQVGAMQTVKLLIKHEVDINAADNEGWTPLHIAMQTRNRNIAKVLLVNGADQTRKNKDGKTPLDISLCYGKDFKSYDLAKLLKQVAANRELWRVSIP